MMKLLKNVQIYNAYDSLIRVDVLFDDQIIDIANVLNVSKAEIINGNGLILLPGFIDAHTHVREPGFCEKETIKSVSKAAAHGGYTSVFAMPNVIPYPDSVEVLDAFMDKVKVDSKVNIYPYACISMQEKGHELVNFQNMVYHGYKYFSDDGVGVQNSEIMEEAMRLCAKHHGIIVAHCEDMMYRQPKAYMHDGLVSKKAGIVGIPSICEYAQVERDLKIAYENKCAYHICHMSCKESVDLLRKYKAMGANVSGEVSVHHLLLNECDYANTNYKMNPPLRSIEDQKALWEGLIDSTIDIIANDHAPHTLADKDKPNESAAFGISNIDHAFSLIYDYMLKNKKGNMKFLIDKVSTNVAKRFNLDNKGEIKVGFDADFVLFDPNKQKQVEIANIYSNGKNSPFIGRTYQGSVMATYVSGNLVYQDNLEDENA